MTDLLTNSIDIAASIYTMDFENTQIDPTLLDYILTEVDQLLSSVTQSMHG